jgi:hypothetical protein
VGLMRTGVRPRDSAGTASVGLGHVFVSHSRWDRSYVNRLVAWLQAAAIPSWISGPERHCPAWQDSVFPSIAGCAAFIVVMTPRSQVAEGVGQEISHAESLGKPVIPIALDGWCFLNKTAWPVEQASSCSPPGAPFLERVQAYARGHLNSYSETPLADSAASILRTVPRSEGWMIIRSCGQISFT